MTIKFESTYETEEQRVLNGIQSELNENAYNQIRSLLISKLRSFPWYYLATRFSIMLALYTLYRNRAYSISLRYQLRTLIK